MNLNASEQSAELFRQIVVPHLPDALALARWLTGSVHDAEDVVQEASIRAFKAIEIPMKDADRAPGS